MTLRISILGLGAMGSRLAANHADAGHDLTVWNRTRRVADELADTLADTTTVRVADSPRDAADGADVVIGMVRDDDAATSIWLDDTQGALLAAPAGSIAVESSTLTPATARQIGSRAQAAGLRFVEAPVVGSRPQAEAGALFYLLAGDDAAIDAAQHVIDVHAGNSVRLGAVGNAATMKLAINGLFAVQVATYAEVAGLLERSDVDSTAALATLAALPITSPGLERILGLVERREFDPNFPIHLVAKDLGYLVDTAATARAPTPMADAAARLFRDAAAGPDAGLDIAGIARRFLADTGSN